MRKPTDPEHIAGRSCDFSNRFVARQSAGPGGVCLAGDSCGKFNTGDVHTYTTTTIRAGTHIRTHSQVLLNFKVQSILHLAVSYSHFHFTYITFDIICQDADTISKI